MSTPSPVALVVGASRGIGRQIAIDLSKAGYKVAIGGKSIGCIRRDEEFPPDPNSPQSTIDTVAREVQECGGDALAVAVDVRDFASVERMVACVIERYGQIDVLVYNAGAIWWASVEQTPMKRFKLMQKVNAEGLYGTIQACLPTFRKSQWRCRIVVVSPPIYSRFIRGKTAYAMGKLGMSVLTIGLAMDFVREHKSAMAITSIWPAAAIQSAATRNLDEVQLSTLRKPTIFSDAILAVIRAPAAEVNGLITTDEDFLRERGKILDFSKYSLVPGAQPRRIMPARFPDLSVAEQADEGDRINSAKKKPKL